MKLTLKMLTEIASHEAIVCQAYLDNAKPPNWTWSAGITSASGIDVKQFIGKIQPMQDCIDAYVDRLRIYARAVDRVFEGYDLTEAQQTAALSFHWNTGKIHKASWVTLWKIGKIDEARKSFMQWKIPASIIERRQKECDLFFKGVWASNGVGRVTEYTRLTKRNTPAWRSGVKVDVTKELRQALRNHPAPIVKPKTLVRPKPTPVKAPPKGILTVLFQLLRQAFRKDT